jgi:hypothetical protein
MVLKRAGMIHPCESLREGLRWVILVRVMGEGDEGVHVNILSDSYGSLGKRGVPWGNLNILGKGLISPVEDDESKESPIVLDEMVGADVVVRNNGGWGHLLTELVILCLEVMDCVLIGSGAGDEGPRGGLGDLLEVSCTSPSPEGLENSEG